MDGQGMSAFDGGESGQSPFEAYPMANEDGDFVEGIVALVPVRAQQPVRLLRTRPERTSVAEATVVAKRGDPAGGLADAVTLEVRQAPEGARVFWRLSPWQSLQGTRALARFGGTRRAGIASAAVIGPDAGVRILRVDLTRLGAPSLGGGGCQVGNAFGGIGVLGLLSLAVSRKIGARRRARGGHSRSVVGAGGPARERNEE
jgi:hypothetical protein